MFIHINNETAPRTFVKFHHTVLHVVIENFKKFIKNKVRFSTDTSDIQIHTQSSAYQLELHRLR